MKTLSVAECQRDLQALDVADQLNASVQKEVERFKTMEMKDIVGKATKMLMTGKFSLEALGLPSNFFEQLEQLSKLNDVARKKYRAHVTANLSELQSIEEADLVGGEHE
ncbi:hypothetical protein [Vibrio fluvialis]|uniref:hypothetical protein n=1 Tax=Vibrio fluvialis TaxID=676 RepID=UPI001405596C|nr:hypothetical protein [Vibrio fluvialis]NHN75611.1 hypothetical protein [Vibrio fluvialis]